MTQTSAVFLWPDSGVERAAGVRRVRRRLPLASLLLLLGLLSLILAMAQPTSQKATPDVHLLIDAGATMGLPTDSGETRLQSALDVARSLHLEPAPRTIIPPLRDLQSVFESQQSFDDLRATSIDTRDLLLPTLLRLLQASDRPIVVISDQPIESSSDPAIDRSRILRIAPPAPLPGTGVESVSYAHGVLRTNLIQQGPPADVRLVLEDKDRDASRAFDIAADRFVEVVREPMDSTNTPQPRLARSSFDIDLDGALRQSTRIVMRIRPKGDLESDDRLWLIELGGMSRLVGIDPETADMLPAAVRRVVEAFNRLSGDERSPANRERSTNVSIRVGDDQAAGPGIMVARPASVDGANPEKLNEIEVIDHPITRWVDWPSEVGSVVAEMPADFVPIAWARDSSGVRRPILGFRESASTMSSTERVRAVWIGFDAGAWSLDVGFVVLWSNVLNFVVGDIEGLTVQGDPFVVGWTHDSSDPETFRRLDRVRTSGEVYVTQLLMLLAVACLAAGAWVAQKRTI